MKNEKKRRSFGVILTACVLTGMLVLSGCESIWCRNATGAALDYLEQRYGQEFVYSGPWGVGYTNLSVKQFLARPVEEQRDVLVRAAYEDDGYTFQDNYLAVKYEGEMRQALQQAAESAFETACVFYEAATIALSSELPADATFAQYSQDDSSSIIATVAVPECQDGQGRTETLEEALKKAGIHGLIRLVVLSQEQFDSATAESVRATIGKETYVRYAVLTIDGKTAQPPAEE